MATTSQKYNYKSWWHADSNQLHASVVSACSTIRQNNSRKRKWASAYLRAYGNYDVAGTGGTPQELYLQLLGQTGRQRIQLCTMATDTAQSIVCANKPLPYYLTDGGAFSEQRKARNKTRLIQGQMHDIGLYDLAPIVARDGMILGSGWLIGFVDEDTGKPVLERALPGEVHFDVQEGIAGHPRSIFRTQLVARERLLALCPERKVEILMAQGPNPSDWEDLLVRGQDSTADLILVTSAWHLPSSKDGSDGRYVMAIPTCTLVDRPYKHNAFPLVQFKWKERVIGFDGVGVVAESFEAQRRINHLVKVVEAQQSGSNNWIWIEGNSEVRPDSITNTPFQVGRYMGTPPVFYKHEATPIDLRQEISVIVQETFQQLGLSQAQIQGEVPQNLKSGTALRMHENIGSRRHVTNQKQYENFFIECARLLERLNDEAAELAESRGEEYYVTTIEQRGSTEVLTKIKWKDAQVPEGSQIRCWPISSLPTTPAGKLQTVQDFLELGFMTKPFAMKLLDFPDLDAAMQLELANLNLVLWHLEQIIHGEDEDQDILPTPMQDNDLAQEIARKTYVHAQLMQVEEERLERIMQYHDMAKMLAEKARRAAQAAMQPPAPPALPAGPGGVSPDLGMAQAMGAPQAA